MFLKSIHLKNFICYKDLELTFLNEDESIRKWTLLLGENGTGKSALIKAIALITSGSDALFELSRTPDEWIRYGAEDCSLSAVLVTKDGQERRVKIEIERGDTITDVNHRNRENMMPLDEAIKHAARNYFVVGFGASRRLSSSESIQVNTSSFSNVRAQSVATLFDHDATLNPLETWAVDLDYTQDSGMETVREVLDDFLPGIKFHKIDKKTKSLLFETPDGLVPLKSLSDGYQNVAAWTGDLLYRVTRVFEDHRSPLEARGLLLIDEMGLHLHPTWQRELHAFLSRKLPNFQIVATTHSPLAAQQVGPGELHYATRKGKRIRIEQFSGNPQDLLLSQLLMTDAFGLKTEESLRQQKRKDRYRELRDKKQLSQTEEKEMDQLREELAERPFVPSSNMQLQSEQFELLQRIEKALQERES